GSGSGSDPGTSRTGGVRDSGLHRCRPRPGTDHQGRRRRGSTAGPGPNHGAAAAEPTAAAAERRSARAARRGVPGGKGGRPALAPRARVGAGLRPPLLRRTGRAAAMNGAFGTDFRRMLAEILRRAPRLRGGTTQSLRTRRRVRGESGTFSGHRAYTSGDDLRSVDWNVYARSDELYLKVLE